MKKTIIASMILFFCMHGLYAATFTVHNFSGRDIFINPFWWQENYVKIAAGQKHYFNSGMKSVGDIMWITDLQNTNDQWIQYKTADLELNALKTFKEFRIYPDGKYEENFMFHAVKPRNNIFEADGSHFSNKGARAGILVNNLMTYLSGPYAAYLVIENDTDGVVLVAPPVKKLYKGDVGFVSGNYHCIAPGGSKTYSLALNNVKDDIVTYFMKDPRNNQWYGLQHKTGWPSGLVAGKIRILPDGRFTYYFEKDSQLYLQNPALKQAVATPVACQKRE